MDIESQPNQRCIGVRDLLTAVVLISAIAIPLSVMRTSLKGDPPGPAAPPAMSDMVRKMVARMPAGWKLTDHGWGKLPARWSIDPDLDPNDCEYVSFEHETARAELPAGPARTSLLIVPASYTGRLYETNDMQAGGARLGWISSKHLVFGEVNTERWQDGESMLKLIESRGVKEADIHYTSPEAARVVRRIETLADADKLKSFPNSNRYASREDDGSGFTARGRAVSDPVIIPFRSGMSQVSQMFQFAESINGIADTRYPHPVNYTIRTLTDRPFLKDHKALMIVNVKNDQLFLVGILPEWRINRKKLVPADKPAYEAEDVEWEKETVSFGGKSVDVEIQRYDRSIKLMPIHTTWTCRDTPIDAAVSIVSNWTVGKGTDDFGKCADRMLDPKGFLEHYAHADPVRYFEAHRKSMESGVYALAQIRHAGGVFVVYRLPAMRSIPTGSGSYVAVWHMVKRRGQWRIDHAGKFSGALGEHLAKTEFALVREKDTPDMTDFKEVSKLFDAALGDRPFHTGLHHRAVVAYAPSNERFVAPPDQPAANNSMEFRLIADGYDIHNPYAVLYLMKPGYEVLPLGRVEKHRKRPWFIWRGRRLVGRGAWGVVAASNGSSGQPAMDAMIENLNHKLSSVSYHTMWIMGAVGDKAPVPALIEMLKHPSDHLRQNAAKALGRIGDPRAVEPLIGLLKDIKIRGEASQALGRIGDRRAVAPLIESVGFLQNMKVGDDYKNETIRYAIQAIGRLSGKKAVSFLIKTRQEPTTPSRNKRSARAAAVYALQLASTKNDGFQALMALLDDKDPQVRRIAAIALGKSGVAGAAAIKKLETVSKQGNIARGIAFKSIGLIRKAIAENTKILADPSPGSHAARAKAEILVKSLTNDEVEWSGRWVGLRPEIVGRAAKEIVALGRPALQALLPALQDKDKFATAHVLMTRIVEPDFRHDLVGEWNGLRVMLTGGNGAAFYPRQIPTLYKSWKMGRDGLPRTDRLAEHRLMKLISNAMPQNWKMDDRQFGKITPLHWSPTRGVRLRCKSVDNELFLWLMDSRCGLSRSKDAPRVGAAVKLGRWRNRSALILGDDSKSWPTMKADVAAALHATDIFTRPVPTPKQCRQDF